MPPDEGRNFRPDRPVWTVTDEVEARADEPDIDHEPLPDDLGPDPGPSFQEELAALRSLRADKMLSALRPTVLS